MPLYDYACKGCDKTKEVLQKHTDPAPDCKKCNMKMSKQISNTSFSLKGYGWASEGYHSRPPWDAPRATKD